MGAIWIYPERIHLVKVLFQTVERHGWRSSSDMDVASVFEKAL
ncbi:hypothetical protein [Legionella impletisoli]|nr:hypothetical protein [Legionella impletisoli]